MNYNDIINSLNELEKRREELLTKADCIFLTDEEKIEILKRKNEVLPYIPNKMSDFIDGIVQGYCEDGMRHALLSYDNIIENYVIDDYCIDYTLSFFADLDEAKKHIMKEFIRYGAYSFKIDW